MFRTKDWAHLQRERSKLALNDDRSNTNRGQSDGDGNILLSCNAYSYDSVAVTSQTGLHDFDGVIVSLDSSTVSMDFDYATLTVVKLREKLKQKGLPSSGLKRQLVMIS